MIEIAAALSGIKGALDLVATAVNARDDAKVREAIAKITGLLLEANNSALSMASEARRLSVELDAALKELREIKDLQAESNLYQLHRVAEGRFVYRFLMPDSGDAKSPPSHFICQNCFDGGVKSVLRFNSGRECFPDEWVCANNEKHTIVLD
jgi:hypothetical protein